MVGLLVISTGALGYQFVLKDYQKERFYSFLNPGQDPLGSNYQRQQALIAVGSGRITGKGYGFGTQSHLRYLPDRHTDFIFASIAEELGLIGSLFLLFIIGLLLFSVLQLAWNAPTNFGFIFSLGCFCLLAFAYFSNIGMNLGLVPVAGTALPFVSYGGSSLVSSWLLLGVLQSIACHQ